MADQALVRTLFQDGYYDNIDGQDIDKAVLTMHPDVEFIHTQVWQGGDLRLGSNHWHGRTQVRAFLTEAAPRLKDAQIRHKVDTVVVDGDRGALQCHVENRDGADVKAPFLVWFELKDDMISRYIVCPYDGS